MKPPGYILYDRKFLRMILQQYPDRKHRDNEPNASTNVRQTLLNNERICNNEKIRNNEATTA